MNEERLVREIGELRALLREKEADLAALRRERQILQPYGLANDEVARYSRQIFMPEVGVKGQAKLKNASVLVVGAGGLGCPSALYLASSGVGRIGIVDYDDVEINNLHRQVLFTEATVRTPKVLAAAEALTKLNSYVEITPYKVQLNSDNALGIIESYDVVLDCTDNAATRYLLNDACVLGGKPLVSGSALKFEGHLSLYNCNGPCYRCIFPAPPPPETVTNCGDGGVLGPAVGTIGVLQALEAVKIILGMSNTLSGRLLLFDGAETKFRNVKLRERNPKCAVCGDQPSIKKLIDYEQFCGAKANDKDPNLNLLKREERITVEEYNEIIKLDTGSRLLIDVRSRGEFDICNLSNSINIPLEVIHENCSLDLIQGEIKKRSNGHSPVDVFVICRRGNDSQRAVKVLQKCFVDNPLNTKDIIGGIHAWSRKIDSTIPIY